MGYFMKEKKMLLQIVWYLFEVMYITTMVVVPSSHLHAGNHITPFGSCCQTAFKNVKGVDAEGNSHVCNFINVCAIRNV